MREKRRSSRGPLSTDQRSQKLALAQADRRRPARAAPIFQTALVFALAALICSQTCYLGAQSYSVADLGPLVDLPGRIDSKPYAMNGSGQVAAANVTAGSYR